MAGDESIREPKFRLCGDVDGVYRTFLLDAPAARLGADHGNDVVLPMSGVSRNHAVLITGPRGLTVEDRGSKNGTEVNGARVVRARMVPGDELTVGSTTLRLEAADPEEARLALDFGPEVEAGGESGLSVETASLAKATASTTARLQWIEAFVQHRSSPDVSLAEALETLSVPLGGSPIALAAWSTDEEESRNEATLIAAAGDVECIGRLLNRYETALEVARGRARESGWQLEVLGTDDLVAGLAPTDGGVAALLVAGDFPGRSTCGPWLRLLWRLVAIFEDLQPLSGPPASRPRLNFPKGFVAGRSAAAEGLYRELEMASGGVYPVLILGETGSGKELVAQTLHRSSPRARQPFVAVNCAAIPKDLLEAEMFGVARGAATGVTARPGCFRRAHGGTLFLDEIGEMQAELQAKLLRVLEDGVLQPVGGSPVEVDVRVLSATHADLEGRIADGRFRADLYYRLAVSVITVPPLRHRPEDLPGLIQHFIHLYSKELGARLRGVSQRALESMITYSWPGNIRQLQHVVRRIVQTALPGQVLDSEMLPENIRRGTDTPVSVPPEIETRAPMRRGSGSSTLNLRQRVADVEKEVIREALEQTGGNRLQAAKLLGISRNTLAAKIGQLGLSPDR